MTDPLSSQASRPPGLLHLCAAPVLGGVQEVLALLAHDAQHHGLRVTAATGPGGPLGIRLRGLGLPVLELPLEQGLHLRSVLGLRRWIRYHRIRLVHAHGARAALYGLLAARSCPRVRLVSHVHLGDPWRFTDSWQARLDRWVNHRADRVLACSRSLRDELVQRQRLPDRTTLAAPNGIDLGRFDALPPRAEARARAGLPSDALLAGCCARLEPQKGLEHLLQAARLLADRLPRLQLVIGGSGSLRVPLETQAARLGLRVHWLGTVEPGRVPELLAALDLYVLPTLNEGGLPLALQEAMAAGVPLVSTTAGTTELVESGRTGLLVPPADASALAEAILQLAETPELAQTFAAAASRHVRQHHSAETMGRRVRAVYTELLD